MSAPVRILGLGGSIRKGSVNKLVLEMMLDLAREFGAETDIADVHTMNLPIFNQDIPREQQPEQLLWLIERMKWADGFFIASPTYLGSLSGAVKNTLDSLHVAHGEPRVYFDGRPVALASFGFHGQVNVINSLAFVTRVMGATVIPECVTISADEDNFDPGIIYEEDARQQIRRTVIQLLSWATDLRDS
ncbi:MAG: NAD(P)H-dependent oxidoreductase [Thermomicrobiales bacterium]|nr:NAD(P)H-dependent oxidoreductase [Thermomicrobiales bacterium]MCO5226209.1 NAD(P)H-dependent oxidoreductase [Thermomicrobiales bacterium]MCO5228319.1 NAD(P)H-dependent oxidoreductase [Thermomicrobiales bacterium]